MSDRISKGLVYLSYLKYPINHSYFVANYNAIMNDKVKIFVEMSAYPFQTDGVMNHIIKAIELSNKSDDFFSYMFEFSSTLLYASYDKDKPGPRMYIINDEKINYELIDYEYFVIFDFYQKYPTTIRIDKKKVKGITRDIYDWKSICINAKIYTHLLLDDDIITPNVYKNGPCSTCLLQPTCLYSETNDDDIIYYYVSKPCDGYYNAVEEEKKNILNTIPKDVLDDIE